MQIMMLQRQVLKQMRHDILQNKPYSVDGGKVLKYSRLIWVNIFGKGYGVGAKAEWNVYSDIE